jgi:hypothetical protein
MIFNVAWVVYCSKDICQLLALLHTIERYFIARLVCCIFLVMGNRPSAALLAVSQIFCLPILHVCKYVPTQILTPKEFQTSCSASRHPSPTTPLALASPSQCVAPPNRSSILHILLRPARLRHGSAHHQQKNASPDASEISLIPTRPSQRHGTLTHPLTSGELFFQRTLIALTKIPLAEGKLEPAVLIPCRRESGLVFVRQVPFRVAGVSKWGCGARFESFGATGRKHAAHCIAQQRHGKGLVKKDCLFEA